MTQARPASYGLGNPPPLHRWMHAVLMLFASLVHGVAASFGMRFNRRTHDWHMGTAREALPRTKPDIQQQEPISGRGRQIRIPGAGRDPASAHRALFTGARLSALLPALILSVPKDAGMTGDGCNTSA